MPAAGPGEVVVQVMAAGVNYNNVWACARPARLGLPLHRATTSTSAAPTPRASSPRSGPGVTRWKAGDEVVDPLQPELRRVPGVQRARPDGLLAAEDLGLRDELGLVRRVLPRAGPAAAAEAAAPDLGGGGVATASSTSPPTGCSSTRPRLEAGHNVLVWGAGGGLGSMADPALQALRRERDRGRLDRTTRPIWCRRLGRARGHRPARLPRSPTTPASRTWTRSSASARRSARPPAAPTATSCSSTSARRRSSRACSSARRSARSSSAARRRASRSTFDVRYLWMRQKTIIGSHFANAYQCLPRQPADRGAQDPARCSRARSRSRSAPSRTR